MTATDCLLTDDTLFNGRLVCKQYKSGYRFSMDAILTAYFCRPGTDDSILDLGFGCGIIGLILAYRYPQITITGIEVQPELVRLAEKNISDNSMQSRMRIVKGNFCHIPELIAPESFDLVVSNPPYRKQGRGRISRDTQRARARHEIDGGLTDMVRAAAYGVKNTGKVVVVYPALRSITLIHELKARNLEPKRIQPVYSYPGQADAVLVLVEAVKNGGEEVRLLPPFYVYTEKNGPYSAAMQKMYE
ncbi:MAG: methyltransferase [Desulfobulbaceae bacterium]|nr:methyltransferase [Desulfobulbaceae bacterium]